VYISAASKTLLNDISESKGATAQIGVPAELENPPPEAVGKPEVITLTQNLLRTIVSSDSRL
jgi:hypothetical protein